MDYLTETSKQLPIMGKYDVLVLGGGPAGVSAAVSSAKTGAKAAIVERYGYLGGQATGGLVILIVGLTDGKDRIIKGFCQETIDRLQDMKATKDIGPHVLFDPEAMKLVFDGMIEEYKIEPYYHTFVSGVIVNGNRIEGVIVDGKSGRYVLQARVYVDATGDADLAKYCNIRHDQENKDKAMPVTLGFRVGGIDIEKVDEYCINYHTEYQKLLHDLGISTGIGGWIRTLHPNEAWFNISNIENIDVTDTKDLTKAEIQGRKQIAKIIQTFKTKIPGFERGYLIDTAPQIGIRESRRIAGLHYFTHKDIIQSFEDTIAKAPNYTEMQVGSVNIPYRCLIVQEINNVIFAGRCISVEHRLLNMFREIPCCMATGQAAGIAASIAAKSNIENFKNIETLELRRILIEQNAIL